MEFDQNDWNHLHDVVLDCTMSNGFRGSKKGLNLNNSQLFDLYEVLPQDLKELAEEWGMNDTCFRDDTWTYLKENPEVLEKIIDHWLKETIEHYEKKYGTEQKYIQRSL